MIIPKSHQQQLVKGMTAKWVSSRDGGVCVCVCGGGGQRKTERGKAVERVDYKDGGKEGGKKRKKRREKRGIERAGGVRKGGREI